VPKRKFSDLSEEGEKAKSEPHQKVIETTRSEPQQKVGAFVVETVVEEPDTAEKARREPQRKVAETAAVEGPDTVVETVVEEPDTDAPTPSQRFVPGPIQLDAESDAAKKACAVATKADDAEVPTHLWDHRALRLLEDAQPSAEQIKALSMLRHRCLGFWKCKTVKELCEHLGPRSASTQKCYTSPISICGAHVHKGITVGLRRWSETGKARYSDWWSSRSRMDKDSTAGFDCVL
jgi:hypothetical protein